MVAKAISDPNARPKGPRDYSNLADHDFSAEYRHEIRRFRGVLDPIACPRAEGATSLRDCLRGGNDPLHCHEPWTTPTAGRDVEQG